MEPELAAFAQSAGTTVVTLMATEAWQRTRTGLAALWHRLHPAEAAAVEAELDAAQPLAVTAAERGDEAAARLLAQGLSVRLLRLAAEHPGAAEEMRRLLDAAEAEGGGAPRTVRMEAHATGSGRVYQAGRDQHITENSPPAAP